jgi:hypothetical protein
MFAIRRQAIVPLLAGALALALGVVQPAAAVPLQTPVGTPPAAASTAAAAVEGDPTRGVLSLQQDFQVGRGWVFYDTADLTALAPHETRTIEVFAPEADLTIPGNATAIVLGITTTNMTRSGWLTAWPAGRPRPTPSTLNFSPGSPVSNLALVQNNTATKGKVSIYNGSTGSLDIAVSFQGWLLEDGSTVRPGSFRSRTPARVVDTRTTGASIPAKGYRDIAVTGHAGIPVQAGAAALNIVVVKPSHDGYLIAHSPSTGRPSTTNLTYRVGTDRAAFGFVPLSSSGKVRLWNMSSAPVNVVVDASGWVQAGSTTTVPGATTVAKPTRVVDTRSTGTGTLKAVEGMTLQATSHGAATLAMFTVTATGATRGGHLKLVSAGDGLPFLYFAPGRTSTATVLAPLIDGTARIRAVTGGDVQVVVDRVALVEAPVVVSGRVTDASTGEPLAGAVVNQAVRTAVDGSYTVPVGGVELAVCATKADGAVPYVEGCLQGGPGVVPPGTPVTHADFALAPVAPPSP